MSCKNIVFKTICVILAITFLVNEVSFAAEDIRAHFRQGDSGQACLAAPLLSKPIVGPDLDSISPVFLLWHLIAHAQANGLSEADANNYVQATLSDSLRNDPIFSGKADLIEIYNWRHIRKEKRGGNSVLVLPFAKRRSNLIFITEPYRLGHSLMSFPDIPTRSGEKSVTVRLEGMEWNNKEPGPKVNRHTDAYPEAFTPDMAEEDVRAEEQAKKKRFDETVVKTFENLGQVCDDFKPAKPQSLILFADDILNNAILYDFEDTLKLLKEKNVLAGGKIVLYVREKKTEDFAQALQTLIEKHLGDIAGVTIVKKMDYDALRNEDDPAKEMSKLAEISEKYDRIHGKAVTDILGIIRGNNGAWSAGLFGEYNVKAPIVIINNSANGSSVGLFSFSEAILLAMKKKAALKDITSLALSAFIIRLNPIEKLTTRMLQEYLLYRSEILTRA